MENISPSERRLRKELIDMIVKPPLGIEVCRNNIEEDIWKWLINISGPAGSLYEGETFQLQLRFLSTYPFTAPKVQFVGINIPIHPFVLSDGTLYMNIVSKDWSPLFTVEHVCHVILSMLSSCTEKRKPAHDFFLLSLHKYVEKHPNKCGCGPSRK